MAEPVETGPITNPIATEAEARQIESLQSPYRDGGTVTWPAMMSGMTFADIGSSGLRAYSGWVREEFLPQLVGQQGARVYREMTDNSPTVGAVLFAIMQSIRKVEWRVEPADDTPAAQEMADFADSLRYDMGHTWEDFITEALSMLSYGYAPHEIVYKARLGPNPPSLDGKPLPASKFNDGRIGIRRLPLRGQDTVIKWFLDQSGGIKGLTQQPYVGTQIDLPIEKLLLFRPQMHKGNPEGRSLLRNAWRPYQFIRRLEEQEAIMVERFGGLPVIWLPSALLEAAQGGDGLAVAQVAAYKRMITNVRIDEQMGVMLPSDVYQGQNGPSSVRMFDFELKTPSGRSSSALNTGTIIERYKLDIMTSVMADFLTLGHSSRGTQSLSLSKVDMFFQAIEGWVNGIAAVLNRHLLPRLWRLNAFDQALMPEYVPDLAQRIDLDALGNYVMHLAQAGMTMFPDQDLENFLRDAAGMPDITDEAAYAASGNATDPDVLKRMLEVGMARRVQKLRGRSVPQ
jgi:hypothetical protein